MIYFAVGFQRLSWYMFKYFYVIVGRFRTYISVCFCFVEKVFGCGWVFCAVSFSLILGVLPVNWSCVCYRLFPEPACRCVNGGGIRYHRCIVYRSATQNPPSRISQTKVSCFGMYIISPCISRV